MKRINKNKSKKGQVEENGRMCIDFIAHCASLKLKDITENIKFETEVHQIEIHYPKTEVVDVPAVKDLKGLIREFKKYFKTWKYDASYQEWHCVDDYYIEEIVIKDFCAMIWIGS